MREKVISGPFLIHIQREAECGFKACRRHGMCESNVWQQVETVRGEGGTEGTRLLNRPKGID